MSPSVLLLVASLSQGQGHMFDFRIQAQAIGLVSLPNVDGSFGGAELQINASIFSFGLAAGVAYEQLETSDGRKLRGGALSTAGQWRFMATVDRHAYHWFDPHLDVGSLIGGMDDGGDGVFRGLLYVGGGIDLALGPDEKHPVITAQYRYHVARTPGDVPVHFLMVGGGFRISDR